MATNSKNTNAPAGIAIHPGLVGGGIDPEGIKAFLSDRSSSGVPCYTMAVMTQSEADHEMARLDGLGAFRPVAEGGYGFVRRQAFFPRSEAVLARHLKAAHIGCYVGKDDSFTHHRHFPMGVGGLVLGACPSASPTFRQWGHLAEFLASPMISGQKIKSISPLRRKGTPVYRVKTEDAGYLLKVFGAGADVHAERQSQAAMKAAGLPVLEQVWSGETMAFYRDPGGECLQKATRNDLAQFAGLWQSLDQKGSAVRALPTSNDARLVLESYANAVARSWSGVFSAAQSSHKQVMFFMMTDLEQLRQDCINHYYLWCKRQKWEKEQTIPEKERFFCPGPLRFDNCLRAPEGLVLLDNSQCGWDDPVHTMADFFFDVDQDLSMRAKLDVLDAFAKSRTWDDEFMNRFWAVADLVSVEWILKLLAVVLPEQRDQLTLRMGQSDYLALVAEHLNRAHHLREHFQPMEHICKHDQLLEDGMEIR